MLKVKVKDIPVFYAGKRYEEGAELTIEDCHANESLFDVIEKVEDVPFKGVKEITLRKALETAEITIPGDADRDALIKLMLDNEITL